MNNESISGSDPLQPSSCRQRWLCIKALLVLLVSCLSFHMHLAQAHEHAAKPQAQQGRHKAPERRAASKPTPHTPPKKEKPKTVRSHAKPATHERKIASHHKMPSSRPSHVQQGKASYYGGTTLNGRLTASGERFNQNELTAAHPSLPFGTRIRVTNLANQRQVVVRVNDRGPFVRGRIIDVSTAAAQRMNMTGQGVAQVRLEVLRGEEVASSRAVQKSPVS